MLLVRRMIAAKSAANSLLSFARYTMPDPEDVENPDVSLYQVAAHHRLIAEAVEKFERGEWLRVCLSIPPQFGKSEIISRRGISWILGRRPYLNIMFGTYNQDFANEFGDDVRTIVQSPEFKQVFPRCQLRPGSKSKDHMVTTQRGKLSFLGRGGSGTGRPADRFVIDDPIKDAKEASSLTIRDDVWNWFTKVVYTRCHAASGIFIVQTRWDEDDLIGRLTDPSNPHYVKEVADKWVYINVPAIIDDEKIAEALGKKVGESLWPERFSLDHLESARALNPVGFSALYQGRPTPLEGAFFKQAHLHTYDIGELPREGNMYLSGDLALSLDQGDHSCVGNWRLCKDGNLWLLPDLYWKQKLADESVEEVVGFIKTHRPLRGFWEKGQIAKAVGPFLEKRMMEEGAYTVMEALSAAGSKGAKAVSIRGMMAAGRVRFPRFAPWWPKAREQLLKFTGEGDKEDDFVDMCSQVGQGLMKQVSTAPRKVEKSNVIEIGTMRWVLAESNRQKRLDEASKRRLRAGGGHG